MKEYQSIIDQYKLHAIGDYNDYLIKTQGDSRNYDDAVAEKYMEQGQIMGEKFLDKYWLPQAEYESIWKPKQEEIFISVNASLPELIFKKDYQLIFLRGGCLFEKRDIPIFQSFLKETGDKNFVVIENTFGKVDELAFRLKFPVDITWKELMSGSYISKIVIYALYNDNEYFVFGESTAWGYYTATDWIFSLGLIGYKPAYSSIFTKAFNPSKREDKEIWTWLPPNYQELIQQGEIQVGNFQHIERPINSIYLLEPSLKKIYDRLMKL